MASIKTGIELQDNFTPVLDGIMSSVSEAVSGMEQMQQTMNAGVDTSAIVSASNDIDAATESARELAEALQDINAPLINMDQPTTPQAVEAPVQQDIPFQRLANPPPAETVQVTPVVTDPVIEVPDQIEVPVVPTVEDVPQVDVSEDIEIPVTPVVTDTSAIDIPEPDVSGVEQYQNAINLAADALQQIVSIQERINSQSTAIDVLPDDVQTKLNQTTAQIQQMQSALDYMQQNPFDLDADTVKLQLDSLNASVNQTLQSQRELDTQLQSMTSADVDVDVHPNVPDPLVDPNQPPVTVPVEWQGDFEIFTSTGVERFNAEVQSTNNALNTLNNTQQHIEQTASRLDILPDGATKDITDLGQRLQWVTQRIQGLENNKMNIGTDEANAGLEQLRSQLDQAIQAQNELNAAMESGDASQINEAYLNLSQTIRTTETYIRDETTEQGRFNSSIQQGVEAQDSLMDSVKNLAAAYLTVQSVEKVIDISDELTQTTARVDQMNDGLQSTDDLMNMIYAAAQDARGSFGDMADVVARFGNNAGDAFSSSAEVVAFADIVQKQMTIAGASTQEASNAMLQLSQALGSGVLRGDELNSIFEQAPNLIQSIASYLDVPIGQIREMASEGELSADVVKAAIFASADEVNAKFEEMPQTFGQIWQSFQNSALMAFKPVLKKLNNLANSAAFQNFVNSAINALAQVSNIVLNIFSLVADVATVIQDNWSTIEPIVMGIVTALGLYYGAMLAYNAVTAISTAITSAKSLAESVHAASLAMESGATFAATAAQYGFNAALLACPITWIIVAIIAVIAAIYLAVAAINEAQGTSISATGIIMGVVATLLQFIVNVIGTIWNVIATLVEFLVNVWSNPEYAAKAFIVNIEIAFLNLWLSIVSGASGAISVIVGIWYGFVQAIRNFVAMIWNFIAPGIEAVVNGWNTGIYNIKTFFIGLASAVLQVAQSILSNMGSAASAIANMFIGAINTIIGGLNTLISALNAIPGVNIGEVSTIGEVSFDFGASALDNTIADLNAAIGEAPETWTAPTMELGDIGDAYDTGKQVGADLVEGWESSIPSLISDLQTDLEETKPDDYWEAPKFEDYGTLADAYETGYDFGEGIEDKISNMDTSDLFDTSSIESALANATSGLESGVDDISGDTGSIADSLDVTEENLKYLRDIAEQEAINRYTTAEITINQTNNNTVNSDMDLDGVVDGLTSAVNTAVDEITEGVHD